MYWATWHVERWLSEMIGANETPAGEDRAKTPTKVYVAPSVTRLGTLAELTESGNGVAGDSIGRGNSVP